MAPHDPPEIADETSHFPYHADQARQALVTDPDPDTQNHPESWYTSADIVDATERYVKAQEHRLRNPGDPRAVDAEQAAAQDLAAVRAYHRRHRRGPAMVTGPVGQAQQTVRDNSNGREG